MAFKSTCPTLAKITDDEPMFVLRAQDASAARAVVFWLDINPQLSEERKQHARDCANAMLAWPHQKAAD